jgi:hypothetical protein
MIAPMMALNWNEEEVKKGINKIKNGKKEGPDGIREEMVKCLVANEPGVHWSCYGGNEQCK